MSDKLHVRADVIAQIREGHHEMLDATKRLKESAKAEGNTLLAVKATDLIRGIEKLAAMFEEMVSKDFEIIGTGDDPAADAFIKSAGNVYGPRGRRQAREVISSLDRDDADYPFMRDALIQAFWDAKAFNQRYTNKRYLNQSAGAAGKEVTGSCQKNALSL